MLSKIYPGIKKEAILIYMIINNENLMYFNTKFKPGDLVEDKKTHNQGIIIEVLPDFDTDENDMQIYHYGNENKRPANDMLPAVYGIHPKNDSSSLAGWWFEDKDLELVIKGFLK
jgi:hypothetical protein